jgi:outer membrane receptor protein involved in Fe transport
LASPSLAEEAQEAGGAMQEQSDPAPTEESPIVVTGTRIRGARVIGEVISLDREAIVGAGQVDLGEAVRSLPQNFSGGQNPGVGFGAGLTNDNVNSASSPNLRGLGADATLTLLNGHRLPYNSAFQGVDISAIPLAAVERVELVPDGASALYGSDAVGGVINIILRRDFEGVAASGQLGAATDGGYFRQQFDFVGGTAWNTGSALLAYDFAHNSQIVASQRSYAQMLDPGATLFPEMERHAFTLTAQQDLAPGVRASVDALYSHRTSSDSIRTDVLSIARSPSLEGYAVAPSIELDLGTGWQGKVSGVYGRDRSRFQTTTTIPGLEPSTSIGRYLNEIVSVEVGLEGPVIALPGGDARLAFGAGIRNNRLDFARTDASFDTAFDRTRRSRFGYAELYLPLISGRNRSAGFEQLTLSGAIRYEDYPGLASLTTPRVGVSYSPIDGLTLRGTWSRSFKAPTLYQQFVFYDAVLLPAFIFGAGSGSETILLAVGGNPDVGPERARSWTVGFELQPDALPGLTLSATWYDVRYKDRVTEPIAGSIAGAFGDPAYASLIDFGPTPQLLNDLISGTEFGLRNFAGAPFDPSNVVALVDNRSTNVADWSVEGLDARVAWDHKLATERSIGFELSASWLDSEQRLVAGVPASQLAGIIFNPPKFRMRGSVRAELGRLNLNGAANYLGALVDRRFAQEQRLAPRATIDVGVTYKLTGDDGRRPGIDLSLNAQNILNDKPQEIGQTFPTDTPYDSTNFSPIGRFITFGVRTRF